MSDMVPALWVVRKRCQTIPNQWQTLPDGADTVFKVVLVSVVKPLTPGYLV